jgi:hypothetical protein
MNRAVLALLAFPLLGLAAGSPDAAGSQAPTLVVYKSPT